MLFILVWIPVVTSAVLMVVYWIADDLSPRLWTAFAVWFCVAVWLQFFARSALLPTVGLVLQVLLAISLAARAKLR